MSRCVHSTKVGPGGAAESSPQTCSMCLRLPPGLRRILGEMSDAAIVEAYARPIDTKAVARTKRGEETKQRMKRGESLKKLTCPPDHCTPTEAARLLGTKRLHTVRKLFRRGAIIGMSAGPLARHGIYLNRASVEAYARARAEGVQP